MNAMKTLFGYLLVIGALVVCSLEDSWPETRITHHHETSADEAQVVCYCVSIILSKPDSSSVSLVVLLMELSGG